MKGVFRFLHVVDSFWDKVFHPVTKTWCWLTGRSNFSLTRFLLGTAAGLIFLGNLTEFVFDPSMWNGFMLATMVPLWLWIISTKWKFSHQLERDITESTDALRLTPDLIAVAIDRTFLGSFLFLLLPGAALGRPTSIGITLYVMALFTMFHFNGGGKSVVRRLADLSKKAVEKVKDMIPEPVPTPIPVPIGIR